MLKNQNYICFFFMTNNDVLLLDFPSVSSLSYRPFLFSYISFPLFTFPSAPCWIFLLFLPCPVFHQLQGQLSSIPSVAGAVVQYSISCTITR